MNIHRALFFAAAILSINREASALEIKASEKGITISAGSLGEFELSYPAFSGTDSQPVHKLIQVRAAGSSVALKYEGGVEASLAFDSNGDVSVNLEHTTANIKSMAVDMLVDIGFNRGGSWKIGDKKGTFPAEKPAVPQLFSDSATQSVITNAAGRNLAVTAPDYAFIQLTDNRAWNWPIFAWKCFSAVNPETKTFKFQFRAEGATNAKKLVDQMGQSTLGSWPGKMTDIAELKSDAASDEAYYAGLSMPARDPFGGLPDSGSLLGLQKTGYFHIETHGDKSWLVDPAGNAFFHTGACGFQPSDDYTYIKGREDIYEWLPKAGGEFASAFREGDPTAFSFYAANLIRKFGRPYNLDEFAARMMERMRRFGFNSIGSFSTVPPTAATKAQYPYVLSLAINAWEGIPRIDGAWEVFDPFDDKVRALIEAQLAKTLPERANDPLLIGYFIINEPRYDELPKVLPSLNGTHACKRRLVQFLRAKYSTIQAFNAAWGTTSQNFDGLNDIGLPVTTTAAKDDVKAFTGEFLEAEFELVAANFRKHDANHLLLGYRLQPVTIKDEQLCRIAAKYIDVMSFNYYTYDVDKDLLNRIHQWTDGKPMMLSEFFWSSPRDSGLTGGREVQSQQERGLMYRNYVEQAASLGYVVGIEWFTLIDQAATGRWFSKYNGESANSGIFSVTDRPWKPMVEAMAKTNHGIYDVLLGKAKPFSWEHAKERGK